MMAAWSLVADGRILEAHPSWLGYVGLSGLTHSRAGLKLGAGQHATPSVSQENFIKRGSDIYRENKKKKYNFLYLESKSANGSDI